MNDREPLLAAENGSDQPNEWSHDLFACCDDCNGECLLAWTIPCVIYGLNARDAGLCSCISNKYCSVVCGCLFSCLCWFGWARIFWYSGIRRSIRSTYGIAGNRFKDRSTVLFCPCCALIQERRQLKEVVPASVPVTVAPLCYNPPQQQAPNQCDPQQ